MKIKILTFMTICTLFSCTSNSDFEKGKKQLEQQGYTDVENTGYEAFCCGQDDDFSTGFRCKNSKGETITGCFCSAIGKSITIRFN